MYHYRVAAALIALSVWLHGDAMWGAVVSGTIDSVGPGGATLVLKVGKEQRAQTVLLDAKTEITLDGKPAKAAELQVGRNAVVFTNETTALRVNIRTSAPTASAPPATVAPKPVAPAAVPKTSPKASAPAVRNAAVDAPWPQFRGPNRDGLSTEKGLLTSWPADGPKLLWTATGMGEGYSSVSVAGGLVLTMGNQGSAEGVMAVSLETGKTEWGMATGSGFSESRGNGPRSVPTVDGNLVYALGANGDLACLELASGKVVWKLNILQSTGGSNIKWGISESVLIDGDKLICTPGASGATMIALNKLNGKPIWSSSAPAVNQPGYASAVVATIGGVRQYVQFTGQGVIGVKADDGALLWQDGSSANPTANCSAPLVSGNFVFSASGYGTGCSLIEIGGRPGAMAAREVYRNRNLINHHGGMVLVDGCVFGCDERALVCLDAKTGEIVWQDRSVGKGSVTYADGHLYVRGENGPMALVEANTKQYVEKGRFEPPRSDRQAWAYPVVAAGKLLLRDQDKLYCYDIGGK